MKTPLTAKRIRQHFTYSWWKYALLLALVLLGWNMTFSVTAYRSPADKKVDVYVYGVGEQDSFDELLNQLHQELLPDMEEVSSVFMVPDETYGSVQLTTYLYAGEGDLYILPKDFFQSYSAEGVFIELENDEELMALCEEAGIDLTRGWRRNSETGERHLYGIPIDNLPGLANYMSVSSGTCMGVMITGGNLDNTVILMKGLIRACMASEEATTTVEEGN